MRIVNVMISKKLGGIEQAFLDYTQALLLKKHKVMLIADKKNRLTEQMQKMPKAEKDRSYVACTQDVSRSLYSSFLKNNCRTPLRYAVKKHRNQTRAGYDVFSVL